MAWEPEVREPDWCPLVNFPTGAIPHYLLYYFILSDFHLMFNLFIYFFKYIRRKSFSKLSTNLQKCLTTIMSQRKYICWPIFVSKVNSGWAKIMTQIEWNLITYCILSSKCKYEITKNFIMIFWVFILNFIT